MYTQLKHQYSMLQITYWMLYCVGYSYVTLYLLHQDFSAGQIGIITAVFGALAALIQPIIGRLADQGGKSGWKPQTLIMYFLIFLCMTGLLLIPVKLLQGILYGCFLMLLSCIMPMINSANFYYESHGIPMHFGISRGLGSLFYAVISFLIGKMTTNGNVSMIVVCGMIISGTCFLLTMTFPYGTRIDTLVNSSATDHLEEDKPSVSTTLDQTSQSFLRKYPLFCLTLIGFILFLLFHNIANTYLLQMIESVGGTSEDYGTAIALSAVLELPAMFGFVYLHRKFSMHTLLSVCGFAFALKSISYVFASNVGMMYATQLFQAFSFALFIPASVYFAETTMAPEDKVKGQSMVTCSITVAAVLGNLIGGLWIDQFGVRSMMFMTVASAVCGSVIVFLVTRRMQHR